MRPLRGAVIGYGVMGKLHARILSELPGVELVAICDADKDRWREADERYNFGIWTEWKDLIDQAALDFVTIATPTRTHADIAMHALTRRMAVLIEKPVAVSWEQAMKLQSLVNELGEGAPVVAVGHVERFNPAVEVLKAELLRAGMIIEVTTERLSPYPERMREAGVGVALDLASHDIDLVRYLLAAQDQQEIVKHIAAETKRLRTRGDFTDAVNALIRFDDGVIANIRSNWLTPKKVRRLTVTGDRGYFDVNLLTQEVWFTENAVKPQNPVTAFHGVAEGNVTGFMVPRAEPLKLELQNFVDCVHENKTPRSSLTDAIETLAIALELERS